MIWTDCLGVKDHKPAAVAATEAKQPQETPRGSEDEPAQWTASGRSAARSRERNRNLPSSSTTPSPTRNSPASFALTGPGEYQQGRQLSSRRGIYRIQPRFRRPGGTCNRRLRICAVPNLPWKFDFADGEVPVTWIVCCYRQRSRRVDGEKVMVK